MARPSSARPVDFCWFGGGFGPTHRGRYAGLAPTGNRVDFTGCSLFEFAGGRVVRVAVYVDAATLMRQVAAEP